MKNKKQKSDIVIYQTPGGSIEFRGDFKKETIWATQSQIADLFNIDRSVITKHIGKIFSTGEVNKKSNVQKMHIANSDKPVAFYSLDIILAVGYKANSGRAIAFRKWATKTLKEHLIKGYTINEKRLLSTREKFRELQNTITFLQQKSKKELLSGQEGEILNLLASYSKTLTLLDQYDKRQLKEVKGAKGKFPLMYEDCVRVIGEVKKELVEKNQASGLFGKEKDNSFKGIIKGLYQTFDEKELYSTLENKAAHLLYFIIKDHPFADGNKRSASFLFVYFLDRNNALFNKEGERKINDNALAALALLIAESDPLEKEQMIALITQLLK